MYYKYIIQMVNEELLPINIKKEDSITPSLSFNASGWLYVFQIGVVTMLQEATELGNTKLYGTSAGAAAATAIALDYPGQIAAEEMCKQEEQVRGNFKHMVRIMKNSIEKLTPDNASQLVNGRLNVVCTELISLRSPKYKTTLFNKFGSRRDVIDVLSATSHIPILGGFTPYRYKEHLLYDGLFTDSHPLSHDKTPFKISWTHNCQCGCTKDRYNNPRVFAPRARMPIRWCFLPPDKTTLRLIFWHGYCEARDVLLRPDFPRHILKLKSGVFKKNNNDSCVNKDIYVDELGRTPISLVSDVDKDKILLHKDEICFEIRRRVNVVEDRWSGITGLIRSFIVMLAIIFPCIDLMWLARPLIEGGRYKDEKEYYNSVF